MTSTTPTNFSRRWSLRNSLAWSIGFVVYTPIAHGVTGAHAGGLTPSQIVAHSMAVAVVGLIVAGAQRWALAPFVSVPRARLLITAVAFNIGYWVGSYLPIDWDTDVVLGFLALGSATWVGIIPINGHRSSATVALLSFPIASVVVELALVGLVVAPFGITPDLQASMLQHSIFWITVGGGSGILGGWLSGLALARMVPPPSGDATQLAPSADLGKPRA
jgi:hypothetical protein